MDKNDKWIYWLEELGQEDNDIVGKKCANLGELAQAGFPTPPGFALSIGAYKKFMEETGVRKEMRLFSDAFSADPDNPADLPKYKKLTDVLRHIVQFKELPEEMDQTIREYYSELCQKTGIEDISVSTRSAGVASHPGMYETYLHVKGIDSVIEHIIKVWSSTFNRRSIISRVRNNLVIHSDPIGVAVLKMVNARTAGVVFTINPATGDNSQIVIDACWGLGEGVVSGSTAIDEWVVNKVSMQIIERKISEKKIYYDLVKETGKPAYIELPLEKQNVACMTDEEVIELAKMAKRVEKHFGVAQDIEWAIDKDLSSLGNLMLLQARPEKTFEKIKSAAQDCGSALDYMF